MVYARVSHYDQTGLPELLGLLVGQSAGCPTSSEELRPGVLRELEDCSLSEGSGTDDQHIRRVIDSRNCSGGQHQFLPGLAEMQQVVAISPAFPAVGLHTVSEIASADVSASGQQKLDVIFLLLLEVLAHIWLLSPTAPYWSWTGNRLMGCCQATTSTPLNPEPHEVKAEESQYCSNEYSLQYYNTTAMRIAETIRAHSSPDGKILPREFNLLGMELRLNIRELDALDSNIFTFYRYFRQGRNFDRDKLVILGAILGSGTVKEKLKVAWSTLPGASEDRVSVASLRWLLDILFSLAGEHLPILSRNDPYADNHELEQAINTFKRAKPKAITLCLSHFPQNKPFFTLQDAETLVDTDALIVKLWRSDGLRSVLTECNSEA